MLVGEFWRRTIDLALTKSISTPFGVFKGMVEIDNGNEEGVEYTLLLVKSKTEEKRFRVYGGNYIRVTSDGNCMGGPIVGHKLVVVELRDSNCRLKLQNLALYSLREQTVWIQGKNNAVGETRKLRKGDVVGLLEKKQENGKLKYQVGLPDGKTGWILAEPGDDYLFQFNKLQCCPKTQVELRGSS